MFECWEMVEVPVGVEVGRESRGIMGWQATANSLK